MRMWRKARTGDQVGLPSKLTEGCFVSRWQSAPLLCPQTAAPMLPAAQRQARAAARQSHQHCHCHCLQIRDGMRSNLFRKGMTGERFEAPGVDPHDPDLVAYW